MLQITEIQEKLELILSGRLKHEYYDESVTLASKIKEVFGDEYPAFLNIQRPKETKKDKDYRKAVFKNPVKGHLSRILDKLIKVEQSEDFLVNYPEDDNGANILRDYCENKFNGSNNLINWAFTQGVSAYAKNSNAVVAVLDTNPPERQTEGYKPYPKIFTEENVLDFVKGEYCILKHTKEAEHTSYYFLDDTNYWIITYNVVNNRERITVVGPVAHYCEEMPAFKIGRHIQDVSENEEVLYKSLLSDSLPDFEKAITRSVDIEVELNHHIHTLEWQMSPRKCNTCKGKKVINSKDGDITCITCNGTGVSGWGSTDILHIDSYEDKFSEKSNFPFNQPAGFVPRNIAAVQELKSAYYNHIDDAYDSIDFGILRKKTQDTSESGISKQYNRLEFSQRIYAEGRHLIENVIMPIYRYIDRQLFGINGNKLNRIPEITIPISFDVMSPEKVLEEIKTAKEAGMSAEIVKSLELKYSKLIFGENAKETKNIIDEINLNPILGMSIDDVVSLFGGGNGSATNGISEIHYIVGANYKAFMDRATREYPKWDNLEVSNKWDIMVQYANEILSNRATMPALPDVTVI